MIPIRGEPAKHGRPWVTLGLIAVNLLIFGYTQKIGPKAALTLFWQGGAVPAKLSQLKVLTSLTSFWVMATVFISLFLHAGWLHLLGNMWFLWLFGEALEDDLGHWRYLAFYLFAGVFACLFHVIASSSLTAHLNTGRPSILTNQPAPFDSQGSNGDRAPPSGRTSNCSPEPSAPSV